MRALLVRSSYPQTDVESWIDGSAVRRCGIQTALDAEEGKRESAIRTLKRTFAYGRPLVQQISEKEATSPGKWDELGEPDVLISVHTSRSISWGFAIPVNAADLQEA